LHVVENGDHSLAPPKRGPLSLDQVYNEVQDAIVRWVKVLVKRVAEKRGGVLIAQAIGEYSALATLAEAFQSAYFQVEHALGEWGMTGLWVIVAAAVIWIVIARLR
jgi:hypothetical protein